MTASWYVVQTRPNSEELAASHLKRQGFTPYLPRYQKKRRHARRIDLVPRPLFPSYLFVAFDTEADRWRAVHSTVGVARLVCHGDRPAPVPSGVVEGLLKRQNEEGFIALLARPTFTPGQPVRLTDGAFAEQIGLYEGMSDRDRVTVLLDLLGRKVRVTADSDTIEAAG
ncbi:transcription antitermination protein RfaH [Agaricicola taiwanensis]|uniref:Transcription antitermination protein RfaH n=1 Tax=Agaricicola taiwanensis TaxID=591372 RepID=A0A8J2YDQ9_9RHOB|nr:transcriptional activator RfaH [Agaricicola taiwanensis]GGE34909.1 transcription antitermination protein RfaH [Agaricicola taiwanensis]